MLYDSNKSFRDGIREFACKISDQTDENSWRYRFLQVQSKDATAC
ncbi:11927_t:CDS:2 [Dentiscutata heterogama]|uniref:11927_t:CDS:1 n=1 Tax=Dentiscutata heterogama TaxID=1316150 RepID=A0ACA9KVY2_9GLOM|nr:11927_t:CDS:2 [Dentiscutata heterogama]